MDAKTASTLLSTGLPAGLSVGWETPGLCMFARVLGSKGLLIMQAGFFSLQAVCLLSVPLVFSQCDRFCK